MTARAAATAVGDRARRVSSSLAAADLLDLGCTTVYDVEGGFQAWTVAGLRTA